MPSSIDDYVYFKLEIIQWKSVMRICLEINAKFDQHFKPSAVFAALEKLAQQGYAVKRQRDTSVKRKKKKSPLKGMEYRRSNKHWPHRSDGNDVFFKGK